MSGLVSTYSRVVAGPLALLRAGVAVVRRRPDVERSSERIAASWSWASALVGER